MLLIVIIDGKREGDGSRERDELGQSDNEELINDQDEYFDSGGCKEKQVTLYLSIK